MKKTLLILTLLLIICPKSYAGNDNIAMLTKQGFFEKQQSSSFLSPCEEIRKALFTHVKDANAYNLDGLKRRYAENYINADGLNKELYFDLIKKTWESYPDIKYRINIKNITINPNIVHVGYQSDVRPYFAISNCLVFPSYREGFPNVVMQAGAMQVPAIVSDINGCNEIVIDCINGFIIPVKDENAIFTAMKKIVESSELFQKMKQVSREMIVSRYEQKIVWDALLKEYQSL